MTTKIRAVKCPNCGSEKHVDLGENRFRCKNCGTEFYIDDDDITINVNHHIDFGGKSFEPNKKLAGVSAISIIVGITMLILFPILIRVFSSHHDSASGSFLSDNDLIKVDDDYKLIIPMHHGKDICFFYLTRRRYNIYGDTLPKFKNGYYYGFIDSKSGKVLKDVLFYKTTDNGSSESFRPSDADISYFYQAKKWYLVIPDHYIYEINPNALTVRDATKAFFANKPAMDTGLSMASLINYNFGEGFIVTNNLGIPYYYFPATNRLYTKDAFEYAKHLPPSELGNELRDSVSFHIQEQNINPNLSRGGRYRLWRVHIKFHLGDPQDANYFPSDMKSCWNDDHRLVSYEPATEWFTAFDCKIIFRDSKYILLMYYPTISREAKTVVQLRSTNGEILWTKALDDRIYLGVVARDKANFWMKLYPQNPVSLKTDYCYSMSLKDGKFQRHYYFPIEYSVPKK